MASFKKFVFLASVAGAAVAGLSYALKYRSYQKELEGEFKEFDRDNKLKNDACVNRKYTALKATTDEFVLAAKDTANSAKGMATAAREMIKDVANIITDNVSSAGDVAKDNAKPIIDRAKATAKPVVDEAKKIADPIINKAKEKLEESDEVDVDFYEIDINEDKKDIVQKVDDVLNDGK